MYSTLKELSFGTLIALYAFGLMSASTLYLFSKPVLSTSAQSSSGASGYIATMIGGETEGVSSETTCCNGVVLEFSSDFPANQFILDGEALFVPGISTSYDYGNEYSEGYHTLGTVRQGLCFIPDDYCESVESILEIRVIGTSYEEA